MSLVAAYSDSGSENETESEDIQVNSTTKQTLDKTFLVNKFNIEDEDQWQSVDIKTQDNSAHESALFSFLPQPKDKTREVLEEKEDEFIMKKSLPAISSQVQYPDKKSSSTRKTFMNLPKPKKGGEKQPVKISIPTFQKGGSDSDSDDGEENKKPLVVSKAKSTLFSMLPKPRHSVTVGDNKNRVFKKETSRVLMPHTLSKKKDANKDKTAIQSSTLTKPDVNNQLSDEDDDVEVSSENFFSLGNSSQTTDTNDTGSEIVKIANMSNIDKVVLTENTADSLHTKKTEAQENIQTSNVELKPVRAESSKTKNNAFFSNLLKKTTSTTPKTFNTDTAITKESVEKLPANTYNIVSSSQVKKTLNQRHLMNRSVTIPHGRLTKPDSSVTEPCSSVTKPYNRVTEPYSSVTEPYSSVTEPYSSVTEPYSSVTEPYGGAATGQYNLMEPYSNRSHGYPTNSQRFFKYPYEPETEEMESQPQETNEKVDYYNQPNEDLGIDASALKALQGSKRRREEVNIIDVHQADIQGSTDDYLKNLTKEDVYASKKSKGPLPRSQEKRKHQITYLAHQAREREMQLRQAWAESRATRQQTQSRYGF